MQKDFDDWNEIKKRIDLKENKQYFKEGEVWWVRQGLNVGYEINGKGPQYMRPVLILKKYNQFSFLGLPLTTSLAGGKYKILVGEINNKTAYGCVSQLRNIDSKRLVNKIALIEETIFNEIKTKTSQINFG